MSATQTTRNAEATKERILDAALAEFSAYGIAGARVDRIARTAKCNKNLIYIYFEDKEALFEELIRSAVAPLMDQFSRIAAAPDLSPLQALDTFFALFEREVLGTDRKLLLRLIIAEGARFPAIAEVYYREVVTRGLRLMRGLAERASAEGVFATEATSRYPQLIVAPLLLAVIWDNLFAKMHPLDVNGLLHAHREVLTGKVKDGS